MGFSWVVCFQLSEWRRNMRRCHPPACLARCHHRHQPSATATWPEIQKAPNPHISPWFAFLYIIILSYHGENMQSWGIPHILGKSRAAGNSWPEKPSNQRPGSEWVVKALADTWPIHVGEALGSFRMVRGLDPRMKIGLEMMNFQKICGWCMDYDYEIPGRLLYNYIYIYIIFIYGLFCVSRKLPVKTTIHGCLLVPVILRMQVSRTSSADTEELRGVEDVGTGPFSDHECFWSTSKGMIQKHIMYIYIVLKYI